MFLPSGQKRAPYGVIYYRLALLVASSLLPVDGKPSPVKSRGLFVLFEWRGVKGMSGSRSAPTEGRANG